MLLLHEEFVPLICTRCANIRLLQLILIDLLSCLLDELAEHSNVVELLLQLVACLVDSFGHLVPLPIQLAKQLLLPLLSLLIDLIFLLTVVAQLNGLVIRP